MDDQKKHRMIQCYSGQRFVSCTRQSFPEFAGGQNMAAFHIVRQASECKQPAHNMGWNELLAGLFRMPSLGLAGS